MGHQPCRCWCRKHASTSVCSVAPTCQLWGLPYPGGSSWELTGTQVLEGFSIQEKRQGRRKCFIPSPGQQGAGMRQMSSFESSVTSSKGKHDGNHNSWEGPRGPTLLAQEGSGISICRGPMGPAQLPAN